MEIEHTPVPWAIRHRAGGDIEIVQDTGKYDDATDMPTIARMGDLPGKTYGNARLIGRACNRHAELLEVLRSVVRRADAADRYSGIDPDDEAIAQARDAIAKAKPKGE